MVCCGKTCSGFKDFLLRGNVVDIAVGIVIGQAFKELVDRFVEGFITPLIGLVGGQPDFSDNKFTVRDSTFKWGVVVNALISFIIISAVIYFFVVIPVQAAIRATSPPPPPDEIPCSECKIPHPVGAVRCGHCGQLLPEDNRYPDPAPKGTSYSMRGDSTLN